MQKPLQKIEKIEITDDDRRFADEIIASRIEVSRDRAVPSAILESCLVGAGILHIVTQTRREIHDYLIGGAIALLGIGLFVKTFIAFRTHREELLNQREFYASSNARRRHQTDDRTPL